VCQFSAQKVNVVREKPPETTHILRKYLFTIIGRGAESLI